jgi:CheY-like chemotaxis protein
MEKHILIVDDALDIQTLLEQFFLEEGYLVSKSSNGFEALAFLRAADTLPDLILLDLMMPLMDGFEFRQMQEKDPKLVDIPIIVMTADNNVQSNSVKIGAKGFLRKPFSDLETIAETVARHL